MNFLTIKGMFLTSYTIAMVTYYVEKIAMTCSLLIRRLFATACLVSTDKDC